MNHDAMTDARDALSRYDVGMASLSARAKQIARVKAYVDSGALERVTPAPRARAAAEGRPCGATFRVLVAEDDAAYGNNVAAAIRSELPAEVDVVGSVAEAMAVPDIGYDVAVIDLDLGDGLGVEVAEHVRAANPEAQVLVMSGYMQHHLDRVSERLDADARHDKSSGVEALVESVRRLSASVRCRAA
jgi:CheY-like chemotaxis protein